MTHSEIREKFLKFFESRGHKIVPSSSLLPTDPSVLFTTAGMQQFKPYYTGEADPSEFKLEDGSVAKGTTSIQKCIRTSDIDEVGDETHLTFFEMLGNFSFQQERVGFKEKAINEAMTFLTNSEEQGGMALQGDRIHVTYFAGDPDLPEIGIDIESKSALENNEWYKNKIKPGNKDNFWGPTGDEGPCGPTVEFYVDGVEIWNLVFNEFYKDRDGKYKRLEEIGLDTGMGLERLVMVSRNKENIFETDLLKPIIDSTPIDMSNRVRRVLADHCRAISFLIADGVTPSNKYQGYVLRRLIRRIMTYSYLYLTRTNRSVMYNYEDTLEVVCKIYGQIYPDINFHEIQQCVRNEYVKFNKALTQGVNELKKFFNKFIQGIDPNNPEQNGIVGNTFSGSRWGLELFRIYESFGLHPEISRDILIQWGLAPDQTVVDEYRKVLKEAELRHQEISRAGSEKKFGGHGLLMDTGELKAGNEEELKKATRLHTATHLLHASLRKVLGNEVHQAGSDITAERLRFDFSFPRKLTPEEIKQVEDLVNEAVGEDYPVTKEEMSYEDAIKSGAMAFFKLKYPPTVNVYSVGDFSKELCGGPHVSHSAEIGKFKIIKEEAVSAGVRRIRATVD